MDDELFYALNSLDAARLRAFLAHYEKSAKLTRALVERAEQAMKLAAERAARLDAWRAEQLPFRRERNVKIMRLARRGLSDDDIGKECDCSGRTVRRVLRAELRRGGNRP